MQSDPRCRALNSVMEYAVQQLASQQAERLGQAVRLPSEPVWCAVVAAALMSSLHAKGMTAGLTTQGLQPVRG